MSEKNLKLLVKPSFKFGYYILPYIIIYLVLITILYIITLSFILCLILIVFCVLFLIFKIFVLKTQYSCISYSFFDDKLVLRDSFFNVIEKDIRYKDIKEVTMAQTFIQRFFNLGSININTAAETGVNNGIIMRSIYNVKEIYIQIRKVVNL